MSDILIVAATLFSPVLAVQAQKWIERFRESRNQKLFVFATLMATRATRLSAEHVRALNTIDMVFRGDKDVIDRWREYQDSLNKINDQTEDRFIDMLYSMSENLKFGFDKVMLRRVVYLPQASC